jgi:transposase
MLPGKASDPGRTGADNRLFVNGVLWVLRSGADWQCLPERYGKWKTTHKRFTRWAKAGVWEKVFDSFTGDPDNQYLMLDSTIVRVHQQGATGKGGPGSRSGAFQRGADDQDRHRHGRAGPPDPLHFDRRASLPTSQRFRPVFRRRYVGLGTMRGPHAVPRPGGVLVALAGRADHRGIDERPLRIVRPVFALNG